MQFGALSAATRGCLFVLHIIACVYGAACPRSGFGDTSVHVAQQQKYDGEPDWRFTEP